MTQGVFIYGSRPKTKEQLREAIDKVNNYLNDSFKDPDNRADQADLYSVVIEATSVFGNEFDGSLAQAVDCHGCSIHADDMESEPSPFSPKTKTHFGPFYLVGPDPYSARNWYATLTYSPDKGKWILR